MTGIIQAVENILQLERDLQKLSLTLETDNIQTEGGNCIAAITFVIEKKHGEK